MFGILFLGQQTCTLEGLLGCYSTAKAFCPGLYFSYPGATCDELPLVLTTCLTGFTAKSTKPCTACYDDYNTNVKTACTASSDNTYVKLGNCVVAKALCPAISCDDQSDCESLVSLIDNNKAQFDTCITASTGDCTCYTAFSASVELADFCDDTEEADLEVCVKSQFKCTETRSTCTVTGVNLAVATIGAILEQNYQNFVTIWNAWLQKTQTTSSMIIDQITQTTDETKNEITIDISCAWDETKLTVEQFLDSLKDCLANSIGLRKEQLTAEITVTTKRGLQSTSQVSVVGNGNTPTSSSVRIGSFFMVPIFCLMAIFYLI